MRIYYIASPRGIKEFDNLYSSTYKTIEELGHEQVDDFIINIDVEKFYTASYDYRMKHYQRVMNAIRKCEVVVVEISIQSMTMGYIIDKASEQGKPVIILHLKDYEPYFFSGIQDEKLQICEYTKETIKQVLKEALKNAWDNMDSRFTLLLPPKIINYLDDIAKQKKTPRSVFIRHLIEREMGKKNLK